MREEHSTESQPFPARTKPIPASASPCGLRERPRWQRRSGGSHRESSFAQGKLSGELLVLDRVCGSQRFVPTEPLPISHPKRLLNKLTRVLPLFALKPDSRGFVQGFFERDRPLPHRIPDQPFHVGIQGYCR